MSRITAERAAAMLLALADEWLYARQLDEVEPNPVPALKWLRRHGLAAYRPPDHDIHPVGEWAASDIGIAWGDSVRDKVRTSAELVALLDRVARGEKAETLLTDTDRTAVKQIEQDLSSLSQIINRRI
jgi:hypothetical protein